MTRAELRWVLLASLAVLLFASLPTIYAWTLADADHVFTGFVYNTEDGNSYIAKMRLGARGEWLFHLFYTPEPHEPALAFPFHLLLGKLAAAFDLSLVLVYHLARAVFGLGLLLTIYAFVARFTQDVRARRLAWALVALGSGLGWLLTAVGATNWLGSLPLDFWVPEAYVFLVLYNLPHLALAESLLLWSILWTLRSFEDSNVRYAVEAGLMAFVMCWVVPFYAGVLAAVLGAYLLAILIRKRQLPGQEFGFTLVAGLGCLPVVAYNTWVFITNPAFATWSAQNRILSPHPLHYILGYLLLLIPAVWGARWSLQEGEERWLLPVAWVLVVPLLLYMPFNLQRRMVAAVQVPLALLAAVGLQAWFRERQWATVAYVGVASLSNLLLVAGSLGPIHAREEPIYRSGDEIAALRWLDAHAQADEIVLASFQTGNVIPAYTDLRVFAGHGPETLDNSAKQAALRWFFDPVTSDQWRKQLLREYRVRWVVHGPAERELGTWDPYSTPYLRLAAAIGEYRVYQVGYTAMLHEGG
jgi:hypothetical protein